MQRLTQKPMVDCPCLGPGHFSCKAYSSSLPNRMNMSGHGLVKFAACHKRHDSVDAALLIVGQHVGASYDHVAELVPDQVLL